MFCSDVLSTELPPLVDPPTMRPNRMAHLPTENGWRDGGLRGLGTRRRKHTIDSRRHAHDALVVRVGTKAKGIGGYYWLLVPSSKALVTSSDALVPSSLLFLLASCS